MVGGAGGPPQRSVTWDTLIRRQFSNLHPNLKLSLVSAGWLLGICSGDLVLNPEAAAGLFTAVAGHKQEAPDHALVR